MQTSWILYVVIGLPLLIFIWHANKTGGHRPDAYKPIQDRPVIPAVIIDVDMPFPSMVVFLFKLALAAIPAVLLLGLVLFFFFGALLTTLAPLRYY